MNQATPQMKTTTSEKKLYVALELSEKSWCLLFGDGGDRVRHDSVPVGDLDALSQRIDQVKEKLGLRPDCPVVSCYEAGRDGFWIHRALLARKVENIIIDPASIEVDQRMRRVKTDRVDLRKIMRHLIRHHAQDKEALRVVTVPDEETEDFRRTGRELERLKKEQTGHLCRIRALLVLVGVRSKKLPKNLGEVHIWNGKPLPANLRAELEREYARLEVVRQQISTIAKQRSERLEAEREKKEPSALLQKVLLMSTLKGIGEASASTFVEEAFGWRKFKNRRQVGGFAGLGSAPHASGNEEYDQGITKAGNRRVRTLAVQIAWCWLRFQPDSALSQWYAKKFDHNARLRRTGIVALARRLLIALWRFVEQGVVPAGAVFSN